MRKYMAMVALLIGVTMLCGCTIPSIGIQNVEDLLRAPQPSPEQNAVQKALNSYLGETMQLKYPRSGTEMTPFIMRDFDGDAQNEAAVLYTCASKGQNVHLAVLESSEGTWEVVYEIEGLSTEVFFVSSAAMFESQPETLLIGYTSANLSDKFLAMYKYENEIIAPIFTQSYAAYDLVDIDNDKLDELIFVPSQSNSVHVIEAIDDELRTSYNINLEDRFSACLSVKGGRNGTMAVDGVVQSGAVATSYYDTADGRITRKTSPEGEDSEIFNKSRRYLPQLLSVDIDGNGSVDVPIVHESVNTLSTTRRFFYVLWCDFSIKNYEKQFGVFDAKYNYYVRMPSSWKNEYLLLDDGSEDGGWELRTKDGNRVVVSVKLVARSADAGAYTQGAVVGGKQLLFSFGEACTPSEISRILQNIIIF